MSCAPANLSDLRDALAAAHARGEPIGPLDLRAFSRVQEYHPEDLTVTLEAGLTLAALQEVLAQHGQWLPLDPPAANRLTIAELLYSNASGPHRFGYGTVREHLLGLKVVLADGRVIRSGGKVVKNVAGYDLQKLLVGSHGSLGVIVEATFKVRPLPESQSTLHLPCADLLGAEAAMAGVLASALAPVVFDLHNLSTSPQLVLAFAGTREEVAWQVAQAAAVGATEPGNLGYEQDFWSEARPRERHRLSILPSRLTEVLAQLGAERFVARAGNGVIDYWGGRPPAKSPLPWALLQRVKDTFDPKHVFPTLTP